MPFFFNSLQCLLLWDSVSWTWCFVWVVCFDNSCFGGASNAREGEGVFASLPAVGSLLLFCIFCLKNPWVWGTNILQVSNNYTAMLKQAFCNGHERLNKGHGRVGWLWLTCYLELQSPCPLMFKSNMSGDLATKTECDTDPYFAESRSAVGTGGWQPGGCCYDSCSENHNLGNYFLNFSMSHCWALLF